MTQAVWADDANELSGTKAQQANPLFLFFWLPAGKDAFGFRGWHEAPLNVLGLSHRGIYDPIALYFKEQYARLSQENAFRDRFEFYPLAGRADMLNPADAESSLRKLCGNFRYSPAPSHLAALSVFSANKPETPIDGIVRKYFKAFSGPIDGHFTLFSSGLYVWRFDIPPISYLTPEASNPVAEEEANTTRGAAREAVRAFLKDVFFRDVLCPLFDLEWQKFDAYEDDSGHLVLGKRKKGGRKDERPYQGVLTYYQLELLYNYLFAAEVMPQIFFTQSGRHESEGADPDPISVLRKRYVLKNIFLSIAMVSYGEPKRQYYPLSSNRKEYSLRGHDAETEEYYFVPGNFVFPNARLTGHAQNELETLEMFLREHFYGRLSFAAMEQFTRVAITFGLLPYREGLECARKIILLTNFRAKENLEPQQLYPESKSRADTREEEEIAPAPAVSQLVQAAVPGFLDRLGRRVNGILTAIIFGAHPPGTGKLGSGLGRDAGVSSLPSETAVGAFEGEVTVEKTNTNGVEASAPLEAITCTPSYAEIYYELIKNKIPGLKLVQSLLSDMRTIIASRAKIDPHDKDTIPDYLRKSSNDGRHLYCLREFYYAENTLHEAIRQFGRQIDAIQEETEALRFLMERSGDREILNELVETRKIHELSAEDRIKVQIDPNQWQQLSIAIGMIGIGIAVAFGIVQTFFSFVFEVYSRDSLIQEYFADKRSLVWGVLAPSAIVVCIAVVKYSWRIAGNSSAHIKSPPKLAPELSTCIYDFANLRERLDAKHATEVLRRWKQKLVDLRFDNDTLAEKEVDDCRLYNVLSEMPTIGLEKRKYSFGSREIEGGASYTLHVEIEVDSLGRPEFYWTDMRIAIRAKTGPDGVDATLIDAAKDRLVVYYVKALLNLPSNDQKLENILRRHFNIPYRRIDT